MGDFPNKSTQFSSSRQPAIPGGVNKKGSKHLSTHIQELLNDEEFETMLSDPREGWKTYKGAPVKAIVKVMSIKAMQGDVKAFDALAKYGYGQKLTLANDEESPITTPPDPTLVSKWTDFLKENTQDE